MSKIIIARRGNLIGPDPEHENSRGYILRALSAGFDVEADVWYVNKRWYFGHDTPQYQVQMEFLRKRGLWLHCKNVPALRYLTRIDRNLHCFWHEVDDYTLTSERYIWTFPGKSLPFYRGIAVLPEHHPDLDLTNAAGICTDFPIRYREQE